MNLSANKRTEAVARKSQSYIPPASLDVRINPTVGEKKDEEQMRNWIDLPHDALFLVFTKLGAIRILYRAQFVCSSWRILSKTPHFFCSLDTQNHSEIFHGSDNSMRELVKEAVDRSCGQLIAISIGDFCSNALLHYIVDNSRSLKRLSLLSCYQISNQALIEAVGKVPHLEELRFIDCSLSSIVIKEVGCLCSGLKYFGLTHQYYKYPIFNKDEEALAIAKTMPQLRGVQLFGNELRNVGLEAILDGCPFLEYLDLEKCLNVNVSGEMEKKCRDRIKFLRVVGDGSGDGYGSPYSYSYWSDISFSNSYFSDIPNSIADDGSDAFSICTCFSSQDDVKDL